MSKSKNNIKRSLRINFEDISNVTSFDIVRNE